MEYIFTHSDNRKYEGKSYGEITIEAEHSSADTIKILLRQSGKKFIDLTLSKKEASGIINALGAANSETKCHIII